MRRVLLILVLLLMSVPTITAQTGGVSYRFRRLLAEPANCRPGDVYYDMITAKNRQCLTAGVWSDFGSGSGTVTSVSGTANQIAVATGTTTPVISLPAAVTLPGTLTLGGTVSGGGNQINNVVIGAVTPLAGSFTAVKAGDGTAALPAHSFTNSAGSGMWYNDANNVLLFTSESGQSDFAVTYNSIRMTNGHVLGWVNGNSLGTTAPDAMFSRRAAANIQHGAADAASPVAQTLSVQNVVTGTSNTAGANFTIAGSQGTGTGVGGSLIFQVAPAGSTGTAVNALATALTINSGGQALVGDGTVSAPTYSFTSAPSYGMYLSGGSLRFTRNGVFGAGLSAASNPNWQVAFGLDVGANGDTYISRQGAGVTQFGTTATNAAGSILATNATLSGLTFAGATGASLVDANMPIQISTGGAATSKYFSANKNGAYGGLFGYDNGVSVTGTVVRAVDANPLFLIVNNTLTGMSIASTGVVTLNATNYNTCTGLTTTAAVLTCTVSDERVKNGISPFNDGLAAIRKINPITFKFSEGTAWYKGGRTELGLSAQNLAAAHPLLATPTGNATSLLQPEPMALHAIEIDAIKKLDARVTALEEENKRLRAQLPNRLYYTNQP